MSEKIKVMHICDKFGVKGSSVHGVSRLFSWWFPRFDSQRFDLKLVGLRRQDHAAGNLIKEGIPVISLNKGKYDLSTIDALLQLVERERPHILHLHGYGASTFGRLAAELTRVTSILHEHFVDPAFPMVQIPFDYMLAKNTGYGIAVSHSVKEFMISKRFLPEEKVEVIFNGAPLQEFKPLEPDCGTAERKRLAIPQDALAIAAIGRLDEQKGVRYFIEAAAIVLQQGIKAKFLVIGDGPLMDDLKGLCKQHKLDEDVIFTGYYGDIPRIQSIIDIQVFPSLWEGTPLTLFEAMSMRRAIVSTGVDGLGEVLEDGKNGLLVPERDAESLAQAILELAGDPVKALKLAKQAEEDSESYDIQRTVDQIQCVYERLASSKV